MESTLVCLAKELAGVLLPGLGLFMPTKVIILKVKHVIVQTEMFHFVKNTNICQSIALAVYTCYSPFHVILSHGTKPGKVAFLTNVEAFPNFWELPAFRFKKKSLF